MPDPGPKPEGFGDACHRDRTLLTVVGAGRGVAGDSDRQGRLGPLLRLMPEGPAEFPVPTSAVSGHRLTLTAAVAKLV